MRGQRPRRAAVVTAVLLFTGLFTGLLTGCSHDSGGSSMHGDTTTLSDAAPDGPRLCGFVPRASVEHVLGDTFTTEGDVHRDSDKQVSGALCLVTPKGATGSAVRVKVGFNLGLGRKDFDTGLHEAGYHQLPASAGLGFSYTADGAGHARVGHGNYLVEVDVDQATGRDAEKDATALVQQVLTTLQLPSDWTVAGDPPPRR